MFLLRSRVALIVAAGALASLVLHAAGPVFWTVSTNAQFLQGTSDGVFVSRDGVVTPGPQLTNRLSSTPAQVWSVAETADGTVFAGTGGDGRLVRARPGQNEETVFDSDQTNIFAVAVSGNRVYAATSPDGQVYVIEGNTPARPFFDPTEKYIWALSVDDSGRVWIGAGNPAVIYRVDAAGNGQAIYHPPAAHVVSLARDAQGRLLAGTASPGRLYRLDQNDRPFVMLDPGAAELRGIVATSSGVVYAASISAGEGASATETDTASVSAALAAPSAAKSSSSDETPESRSRLFRIDPDGTWEPVWSTTDVIYDLALAGDSAVLVATGPNGRIYRVEPAGDVLLLSGVDAKQITRFAGNTRPGLSLPAFAAANPGRLVTPGTGQQSPAFYVSGVRDSESVARWGVLRWEATGGVRLYTRSGNTATPDDSWSDWAGPYSLSAGAAIISPAARYLQFRAELTAATSGPDPRLTSVTVAYLPRNNRPVVSDITVYPPGVVFQRPFSSDDGVIAGLDDAVANARRPPGEPDTPTPALTKRMFQKGLQTLTWKAEDADADHLAFALRYRREGTTEWQDLRRDLIDTVFVWDTTSVPDGRYVVRIEASDNASNAADRALEGSRESGPITIDNTPPQIESEVQRTGGRLALIVRVHDGQSPIQKLEYSLAGGPWQVVYPSDGVADAPDERYEVPLGAESDLDRLVLRAIDLLQNVASSPAVRR